MSQHQILLLIHLLAIALALGMGFSNIISFRVARSATPEQALGIAKLRRATGPYLDICTVLIILAGVGLIWDRGGTEGLPPMFHWKMTAVVLWLVSVIILRFTIRRFAVSGDMSLMPRIRMFAHLAMTFATLAFIAAILTFAG